MSLELAGHAMSHGDRGVKLWAPEEERKELRHASELHQIELYHSARHPCTPLPLLSDVFIYLYKNVYGE